MKILLLTPSTLNLRNSLILEYIKDYNKVFKDTSNRFRFIVNREGGFLDKEDLIQELYLKLIDNLDKKISSGEDFSPLSDKSYLYRSSSNWMKNYLRFLSRQKRGQSDEEEEGYVRIYIEDFNPEVFGYDGLDTEVLYETVQAYLDRLSPDYLGLKEVEFEVFKKYFLDDEPQAKIAEALGIRQQRVSDIIRKIKDISIPVIKSDIETMVLSMGM